MSAPVPMSLYTEAMTENTVTPPEFAKLQGVDIKTVRRWLKADRIVGAVQADDGRWSIPVGAAVRMGSGGGHADMSAPVPPSPGAVIQPAAAAAVSPLGALGTLEEAARILHTTVGGIRRMSNDGLLTVGPYGPNGALRVYVRPPQ